MQKKFPPTESSSKGRKFPGAALPQFIHPQLLAREAGREALHLGIKRTGHLENWILCSLWVDMGFRAGQYSLGVMVSPSSPSGSVWPMPKREWPRQGQITSNHKLWGSPLLPLCSQTQPRHGKERRTWSNDQLNNLEQISLKYCASVLIQELDCCVYLNSVT